MGNSRLRSSGSIETRCMQPHCFQPAQHLSMQVQPLKCWHVTIVSSGQSQLLDQLFAAMEDAYLESSGHISLLKKSLFRQMIVSRKKSQGRFTSLYN